MNTKKLLLIALVMGLGAGSASAAQQQVKKLDSQGVAKTYSIIAKDAGYLLALKEALSGASVDTTAYAAAYKAAYKALAGGSVKKERAKVPALIMKFLKDQLTGVAVSKEVTDAMASDLNNTQFVTDVEEELAHERNTQIRDERESFVTLDKTNPLAANNALDKLLGNKGKRMGKATESAEGVMSTAGIELYQKQLTKELDAQKASWITIAKVDEKVVDALSKAIVHKNDEILKLRGLLSQVYGSSGAMSAEDKKDMYENFYVMNSVRELLSHLDLDAKQGALSFTVPVRNASGLYPSSFVSSQVSIDKGGIVNIVEAVDQALDSKLMRKLLKVI